MAEKDDKNPEQDSLLREIEEDLRHENLSKLWKKYGYVLIGGAVALVIGVAGFKGWQSYDADQRAQAAGQLLNAARGIQNDKATEAEAMLKTLSADGPSGYAALARFQAASLLADRGDKAAAAAAFDALAQDGSLDVLYRDMALMLGVLVEADTAAPADQRQRLAALLADDNPWRHSARELTALAALKAGDKADARSLFEKLSKDTTTPASLRQRADAMVLHLKD